MLYKTKKTLYFVPFANAGFPIFLLPLIYVSAVFAVISGLKGDIMSTSNKIKTAIKQASWIRKMFEEGASRKAIYGAENVFDFSIGNPNLEPPAEFKAILNDLINDGAEGLHCYMSNAGYEDTREAVANYLNNL